MPLTLPVTAITLSLAVIPPLSSPSFGCSRVKHRCPHKSTIPGGVRWSFASFSRVFIVRWASTTFSLLSSLNPFGYVTSLSPCSHNSQTFRPGAVPATYASLSRPPHLTPAALLRNPKPLYNTLETHSPHISGLSIYFYRRRDLLIFAGDPATANVDVLLRRAL